MDDADEAPRGGRCSACTGRKLPLISRQFVRRLFVVPLDVESIVLVVPLAAETLALRVLICCITGTTRRSIQFALALLAGGGALLIYWAGRNLVVRLLTWNGISGAAFGDVLVDWLFQRTQAVLGMSRASSSTAWTWSASRASASAITGERARWRWIIPTAFTWCGHDRAGAEVLAGRPGTALVAHAQGRPGQGEGRAERALGTDSDQTSVWSSLQRR